MYIYIFKHISDPDIFYIYLHSLYFNSAPGAERNVAVQWQGQFVCLSFYFCWTAITLCGRIKIIKADGWWLYIVGSEAWIPVHNVYWSNGKFHIAICMMAITHSKTDRNYTECFCSKLTPIHNKWHIRLSKKLRKPPFRFTRIINWNYTFFSCKCIILTDTISFLPYFHFHLLD